MRTLLYLLPKVLLLHTTTLKVRVSICEFGGTQTWTPQQWSCQKCPNNGLTVVWNTSISLVFVIGRVSSSLITHKYLRTGHFHTNFNTVVNAFNPILWEAEEEGSWVQGQPENVVSYFLQWSLLHSQITPFITFEFIRPHSFQSLVCEKVDVSLANNNQKSLVISLELWS